MPGDSSLATDAEIDCLMLGLSRRVCARTKESQVATQPNLPALPTPASGSPSGLHLAFTEDASAPRRSFSYVILLAVGLDYLSVSAGIVAGLAAYHLFRHTHVSNEGFKLFVFSIQYVLAFVLFGRIHSLYTYSASLLHIRETAGILRVSVFSLALLCFGILFSQIVVPRLLVLLSWIFITLFVILQKHTTRKLLAGLRKTRTNERRVLIVGCGSDARRIFSYLSHSPDLQMKPIGFFEEQEDNAASPGPRVIYSHDYSFREHAPVFSGALDGALLDQLNVSDLFVASAGLSSTRLAEIAAMTNERAVQLSFVGSSHPHIPNQLASVKEMDGLVISSFTRGATGSFSSYELAKRIAESMIAVFMILVSLPVWAGIAVWIKLSSDGPVFFKQERIGLRGKPFPLYKFRSMYTTAPKYGRSPEDSRDPRITPAGRFLRKTSLDELPQLLNVLRGEMALVGPRPEMPYVVEQYTPQQAQRLAVTPGLTGLWQLSADRKFAIHESLEYDLYYIENRGFFLDMAILLHTAAFAMKGI